MAKSLAKPTVRALSAALVITLAACTITPRTGKPAELAKSRRGLDAAVNCVLASLNESMSKGKPPNFTHTVSVVTPGQVEEIIPHEVPSGRGELYVVRFMAADDGTTNIQLFSTLDGLDKRVEQAIAPCKDGGLKPSKSPQARGQSGDSGGPDTGQLPWLSRSKPSSQ